MRKFLWHLYTDAKVILRDRILILMLLLAPITLILARWFYPILELSYPFLRDYRPVQVTFLCTEAVLAYGFAYSVVLLEEQDEDLIRVFRILPQRLEWILVYKFFDAFLFCASTCILVMLLNGLTVYTWGELGVSSLCFGLCGVVLALGVAAVANNKVEGLAFFKGFNLLLMLPILAYLFEHWALRGFMPFPAYFAFALSTKAYLSWSQPWLAGLLAVLVAMIYVLIFGFWYWRKVQRIF